jgi:hypothetical protein
MVVPLEAIFRSTFVMNERLLQLSGEILGLTKAVHATTTAGRSTGSGQSPAAGALQPDRVPVVAAVAIDPRRSS